MSVSPSTPSPLRRGARGRLVRAIQRGERGRYDRCQGEAAPSIRPDCNARLLVYMSVTYDGDSTLTANIGQSRGVVDVREGHP